MNASSAPARKRLSPAEREQQIVDKAIEVFSQLGFSASTRELASALGITQPLLYKYFATKEDLIERVYDEVFNRPWNSQWESWICDRTIPFEERLRMYFNDYATYVTRPEYVRLFLFAGLTHNELTHRYMRTLFERHFKTIGREMRHAFDLPQPETHRQINDEFELIWATHSSIFYMGVRQWVYDFAPVEDVPHAIDLLIDGFLKGVPATLRQAFDAEHQGI